MIKRFLISLFRFLFGWLRILFRTTRKPFKPTFDKPGEWARFVKSFHFDTLPNSRKGATFRQIMSFRS